MEITIVYFQRLCQVISVMYILELNKIQRLACVGIILAMKTYATATLKPLFNLGPLHMIVKTKTFGDCSEIGGRPSNRKFIRRFRVLKNGLSGSSLLGCPLV